MDANETATRAWELRLNMMRVALSILRNGADAEDAISEAILKACRSAGRLRTEEQFKPWLISRSYSKDVGPWATKKESNTVCHLPG